MIDAPAPVADIDVDFPEPPARARPRFKEGADMVTWALCGVMGVCAAAWGIAHLGDALGLWVSA